jgi:hypothetical protein
MKGTNAWAVFGPRLEPEPEDFCDEDEGTGGGAISGAGSRKTEIFELEAKPVPLAEAARRFDLPGCLIVDPAIFFTSGIFSLILVFRVPTSVHSFVLAAKSADCASSPDGSTNICRRVLFRRADEEVRLLAGDARADCVEEDTDD